MNVPKVNDMRSINFASGTYAVDFLSIQQQCTVDLPGSQYHVNNDFVLGPLAPFGLLGFLGQEGGEGEGGHSDGEFVNESPTSSAVDLPRSQ